MLASNVTNKEGSHRLTSLVSCPAWAQLAIGFCQTWALASGNKDDRADMNKISSTYDPLSEFTSFSFDLDRSLSGHTDMCVDHFPHQADLLPTNSIQHHVQ